MAKRKRDNSIPLVKQIELLLNSGAIEIDLSNSDEVTPRKYIPVPSQDEIDAELQTRMYYLNKKMKERRNAINELGGGDIIKWLVILSDQEEKLEREAALVAQSVA